MFTYILDLIGGKMVLNGKCSGFKKHEKISDNNRGLDCALVKYINFFQRNLSLIIIIFTSQVQLYKMWIREFKNANSTITNKKIIMGVWEKFWNKLI